MISAWTVYIIGIVDQIAHVSIVALVLSLFLFVGCIIGVGATSDCYYDSEKKLFPIFRKWARSLLLSSVVLALITTLTPNSKTLAAMYVIPAIANNEKLQAIGSNGLEILERLTGKWVQELGLGKEKKNTAKENI